jgi:hypothetical protein
LTDEREVTEVNEDRTRTRRIRPLPAALLACLMILAFAGAAAAMPSGGDPPTRPDAVWLK